MTFAHISWLYIGIFILPVFLVISIFAYRKYYSSLTHIFSIQLLQKISVNGVTKIKKVQLFIYFIIFVLFIISLSGPQWGVKPQEVKTYGVDLILIIDTSKSMLAEDVPPNRIEFVKRCCQVLLNRIAAHRVGIITFAGIAFYHCPLTTDLYTAKELLSIIDTDIVPYPGTKIGFALQEALRVLRQTGKTTKVVVLFTDAEDHDSYSESILNELIKEKIIVYTVGVGTPEGRPIPIRDASGNIVDYKKDKQGNIVTTKLNEQLLYEIAEKTGGRYFSYSYGELGIADGILNELESLKKTKLKSKIYYIYTNRYYYFVYLLIILFLAEIFVPKIWWVKI